MNVPVSTVRTRVSLPPWNPRSRLGCRLRGSCASVCLLSVQLDLLYSIWEYLLTVLPPEDISSKFTSLHQHWNRFNPKPPLSLDQGCSEEKECLQGSYNHQITSSQLPLTPTSQIAQGLVCSFTNFQRGE
nr:recQ-mediated genome instability protein 1 isoform X5 [Equus caballus]